MPLLSMFFTPTNERHTHRRIIRKLKVFILITCAVAAFDKYTFAQPVPGHEYALINYTEHTDGNPVSALIDIESPDYKNFVYEGKSGFLASLLDYLGMDAESQILVFSATSLQKKLISSKTPRALYFSENTYVGWVPESQLIEIATMDINKGLVFYTMRNEINSRPELLRENHECLFCHDTGSMAGGGTPSLMARSVLADSNGNLLHDFSGMNNVSDSTPLDKRWGGWYVSGHSGAQTHLGNIVLAPGTNPTNFTAPDPQIVENFENNSYFDANVYLKKTSDIVNLLIMEHQLTVQNQIIYVKFKAPAVLERFGFGQYLEAQSWNDLPENAQKRLLRMLNRLVDALMLTNSIGFIEPISSTASFINKFQTSGFKDSSGRSLRDLDLTTRLFRYPLSYLIYSEQLATLPVYAREYVYTTVLTTLKEKAQQTMEPVENKAIWSPEEYQAAYEILRDTATEMDSFGSFPLAGY